MVSRKMRMLAASLALVMFVSLCSAPKASAVVAETAIGTAAVASYFQATGLTMAASAGSTGALITTGVADIAGSYAMATGAASSGSAFLSSLAAGVSISPAGALVLTAAAVVAIGALVAWYVGENGLDEEGSTSVAVPGTSERCLFGDVELPALPAYDTSVYPNAIICFNSNLSSFDLYLVESGLVFRDSFVYASSSTSYISFSSVGSTWDVKKAVGESGKNVWQFTTNRSSLIWTLNDIWCSDGSLYSAGFVPVPVGDVQEQLEVTRTPEFTQPDIELDSKSQTQMVIDAGFSPGITLDTVATEVPNLIAAGTLAPTYEITTTELDEGTDTAPDEETGIYIPVLSDIKTRLDTLGDSVVDGIMDGLKSLVVPDEAFFAEAIPVLQETFQGRMGLLTFPISLMADFLDRLLTLSDQEPILRWDSIRIYGTQLIAAGQYNLKDSLASARVRQMYDIYMVLVNAILVFAFLGLCQNKYRKIMQN